MSERQPYDPSRRVWVEVDGKYIPVAINDKKGGIKGK